MSITVTFQVDTPYLTVEEYARRASAGGEDLTPRAVQEMCLAGKLPTKPREKGRGRIFVNNALLLKQALSAAF